MAEVILPGTYITVRDEGLISAGRVAAGYVGIVGTAAKGPVDEVTILGSFTEARETFGESDPWQGGGKKELTLIRALEQVYNNGGKTVYAVRTAQTTGTGKAASATYDVKKSTATLATLEAKSPGTWGNAVKVKIAEGGKTLELSFGAAKETFTGDNVGALAEAVNKGSSLASATVKSGKETDVPDAVEASFTGGVNGEGASLTDYKRSLALLENEIVNIVVLAGQDVSSSGMATALQAHLNTTAEIKRERIGVIGSNGQDSVAGIAGHTLNSDRLIFVAPGIKATIVDPATREATEVALPGAYTAAAVAGLISSLPVQASPTNKTLTVGGVSTAFTSSQLEKLVQSRVLAVEKREGYRVVKGITTATNSAWHQITTRRIVDYAVYGVRSACNPYIGKLNNTRVRSALKATLDAFLTRMVDDEQLVGYQLDVSATRPQEIAGEAIVTMTIQPTFSIDFVKVTMYLG